MHYGKKMYHVELRCTVHIPSIEHVHVPNARGRRPPDLNLQILANRGSC